jgi:hypothetical protein
MKPHLCVIIQSLDRIYQANVNQRIIKPMVTHAQRLLVHQRSIVRSASTPTSLTTPACYSFTDVILYHLLAGWCATS